MSLVVLLLSPSVFVGSAHSEVDGSQTTANLASENQMQQYTIDSEASSIKIITDKGGVAAFAAHQHLISINNIQGTASFSSAGVGQAELTLQPALFAVDDADDRALYPEVFEKPVPEKAIKGTRENMLGKKLLSAKKFPEIKVSLTLDSLNDQAAEYTATVNLRGKSIELKIPGKLKQTESTLFASAEFKLSNPDLGMKVFSAMFGAISVGRDLKFMVDITARKAP